MSFASDEAFYCGSRPIKCFSSYSPKATAATADYEEEGGGYVRSADAAMSD